MAKIAFNQRMWTPQDLSWNPHVAHVALMETSWGSLAYGFASVGKLSVYGSNEDKISLDRLYSDAIELSQGVFTISVPHNGKCTRFICNCKIH